MAWLPGYTYRKKKPVNSTTAGAQTNFQCELLVGESSGASGEEIDCESHCQEFPDDIRFTAADGITEHDYWVQSVTGITPNRLATIKIEVASIPASGSVDLYVYYGKSGDSGESNGDDTFLSFNDLTGIDNKDLTHNSTIRHAQGGLHIDYINTFQIIGNYAYCAVWQSGTLTILNISNPASVTEAGYTTSSQAHDIKVIGNIAYVIGYTNHTLSTYNISNPSSITSLDSIDVGGTNGMYLFIEGDYAYVTVWDSGTANNNCLKIYNISDPENISYVSQICHNGSTVLMRKPWGIEKTGNYLYIGSDTDVRVNIFNVSNPNSPSFETYFNTEGYSLDPLIKGDYYYGAGGSGKLRIYNVSTPTSPSFVSETDLDIYPYHRCIDDAGDYLYNRSGYPAYANDNGVKVICVIDKENPFVCNEVYGAGSPGYYDKCHCNVVVGNVLYSVGYNADSFITTDISVEKKVLNPANWEGDVNDVAISSGIGTLSGDEKYIHKRTNQALPFVFETRAKLSNDEIVDTLLGFGDESPAGSYENFTEYTEVDPNSHITVEAAKLTGGGVTRNEDAYVYNDFGVDNFNALDIQFEINFTSGANNSLLGHVALSNTIDDIWAFGNTEIAVYTFKGATDYIFLKRGASWGTYDRYAMTIGTTYYCILKRTAGSDTVELEIRTGSHTGTLVDTLSISGVGTSTKWRYLYGMSSCNSGNAEAANGWTQNVCLSAPCTPEAGLPKNGIMYRGIVGTDKIYTRVAESWNDKGTINADLDAYQIRKFIATSTNVKAYYNDTLDKEITSNLPTADMNVWLKSMTSADVLIDWMLIRKYCNPEPTWAISGEEEEEAPVGGHPTMARWHGIPGMNYTGRGGVNW